MIFLREVTRSHFQSFFCLQRVFIIKYADAFRYVSTSGRRIGYDVTVINRLRYCSCPCSLFLFPCLSMCTLWQLPSSSSSSPNPAPAVYLYAFNHRTSGNKWPEWTGAAHGYEIDHVFGVPLQAKTRSQYREDERALSDIVIRYWTNFAKTGLVGWFICVLSRSF